MVLAELPVGTVKADPAGIILVGTPFLPLLNSRVPVRVVVIERPLIGRPAVVGGPRNVAALEK